MTILMECGHPIAARRIVATENGHLVTDCWACAIEAEPRMKPGWPAKQTSPARDGRVQ